MPTHLDESFIARLADEHGLFHAHNGAGLSRGLTRGPLLAIRGALQVGMRTLETGCGGSTVVFAAAGTRHKVVTPDREEVDRVQAFCETHGISLANVRFELGSSDRVLVGWDEPLDVVLIDGGARLDVRLRRGRLRRTSPGKSRGCGPPDQGETGPTVTSGSLSGAGEPARCSRRRGVLLPRTVSNRCTSLSRPRLHPSSWLRRGVCRLRSRKKSRSGHPTRTNPRHRL